MAKKQVQPTWPQHCRGIMNLKRIKVREQLAIVSISSEVVMPLHQYQALRHQPTVDVTVNAVTGEE